MNREMWEQRDLECDRLSTDPAVCHYRVMEKKRKIQGEIFRFNVGSIVRLKLLKAASESQNQT